MRFVSRVLVGVCAGLMLGVSALPASAAEWFVSPQGSDATGDGSLGKPLRTLGHLLDPARELVRAGDTVTLATGEQVTIALLAMAAKRVSLKVPYEPGVDTVQSRSPRSRAPRARAAHAALV